MMTESAPIPIHHQVQALMAPAPVAVVAPTSTKKKMIIAAVAGLVVAVGVVAVVLTGDDERVKKDGTQTDEPSLVKGDGDKGAAKTDTTKQDKPAANKPVADPAPPPPPKPKAATSSWTGRRTFYCRGNDVHVLRNVKANTGRRTAIMARNGCTVYCVDCTIVSRNRYAVKAYNTAKVYLVGGKVIGKKYAIYALHSSTIVYAGTRIIGRKKRLNRAVLRKLKADEVKVPE